MNASLYNLNASAYHYQLAVQERFQEICEPLFKLGIKYFSYGTVFETGAYLQLSNNQKYVRDHCFTIKSTGNLISKIYPSILKKSYFILPHPQKGVDKVIDLWVQKLKIVHHFSIVKNNNLGCLYCYCFFTDEYDPLFYQFCLNNISLLERFCDYFDEKAKAMIDCKDQKKLAFFDDKIEIFSALSENMVTQKVEQFLQETFLAKRILRTKEKDIYLSKRETECLHFLSMGKTIKEIARVLELSPRSVEFYLQNIKKKSRLNRGELITHFVSHFSTHCHEIKNIKT